MITEVTQKSSSKKLLQQTLSMNTQFIMLTFYIHVEAAERSAMIIATVSKITFLLIYNNWQMLKVYLHNCALYIQVSNKVIRYMELYGVDCDDLSQFNLVIDTSYDSPERVADRIVEAYFSWLQPTSPSFLLM
jgi:hypothetical protein